METWYFTYIYSAELGQKADLTDDEINMQWARSVMPANLPAPKRVE